MKKVITGLLLLGAGVCFPASAQERFVSEEPQNRNAVLEEFTGAGCSNCPAAHKLASQIYTANAGDFVLINIHTTSLASPSYSGNVDLRSDYGSALASQAGVYALPMGTINRHRFEGSEDMASTSGAWAGWAEEILASPSYANIAARATIDPQNRSVELRVQIYYTGDSPADANYLNVALLQDSIAAPQKAGGANPAQSLPDGRYLHMHVLRDMLTGQWGEEITTTTAGSFVEKTYTYAIPDAIRDVPVDPYSIRFAVFLSEGHDEIVTGCNAGLTYTEGGPDILYHFGAVKQAPNNTCDANIRISANIEVLVATEPIESLDFNFDTPLGREKFSATFNPPLEAGDVGSFTSEPLEFRANESGSTWLYLTKINGSEDYPLPDAMSLSFSKNYVDVPTEEMILTVAQDMMGGEITWDLVSSEGDTLGFGGPYETLDLEGILPHTHELTLIDGCHQLTIHDAGGDGINNGQGEGYIQIDNAEGDSLVRFSEAYTDQLVIMVSHNLSDEPDPGPVDTTANESRIADFPAVVIPNPASDAALLHIDMEQSQTVSIRVMNTSGQCVADLGSRLLPQGRNTIELPVRELSAGLYFIAIQSENRIGVRKLMVNR